MEMKGAMSRKHPVSRTDSAVRARSPPTRISVLVDDRPWIKSIFASVFAASNWSTKAVRNATSSTRDRYVSSTTTRPSGLHSRKCPGTSTSVLSSCLQAGHGGQASKAACLRVHIHARHMVVEVHRVDADVSVLLLRKVLSPATSHPRYHWSRARCRISPTPRA